MGLYNVAFIDTTPGANAECPFCPPKGNEGSPQEYWELCRSRYKADLCFSQRMVVAASYAARPENTVATKLEVVGPYAELVWKILASLKGTAEASSS
ncbi:hypothetical protein R50073_50390 (plasmid) [Maricurvus nonylphenolicus]